MPVSDVRSRGGADAAIEVAATVHAVRALGKLARPLLGGGVSEE